MRPWAKRNDKKKLSLDNGCNPFYYNPFYYSDYNYDDYYGSDYEPCSVNADKPENSPLDQKPVDAYQYSFVGPLSMQKGCDNTFHMYTKRVDTSSQNTPPNNGIGYETNKLSYRGMNDLLYLLCMDYAQKNMFQAKIRW